MAQRYHKRAHLSTGDTLYVAYVDDADAGSASIDGSNWTAVVSDYTVPASGVPDSGLFYLWKKAAAGTTYTVTSTVSERNHRRFHRPR